MTLPSTTWSFRLLASGPDPLERPAAGGMVLNKALVPEILLEECDKRSTSSRGAFGGRP
ncbi:MAG: hypothetical protein QOJ10_1198 [Chloroflexota bacterium]|jgi:hypothetical protein|nr:hypothetical protein [Chloroflexota bacterium]